MDKIGVMRTKLDIARIRRIGAEHGFLMGVKEMVRQKVEMGVMPWGDRVYYPKMMREARPQKLRDFAVEEEVWELNRWREEDIEKYGERHHLNECSGRFYLSILFKSTRGRAVRRKISLGTRKLEVACYRRDKFYKAWAGKALKWYMAEGAKWNMRLKDIPEIGEKSRLEKEAEAQLSAEQKALMKARVKEWREKRRATARTEPFIKEKERIFDKRKPKLHKYAL